jgi:hypothetical protein
MDNGFLYDTDGTTLIGVNLGADYCAEHEWGIKGLHGAFAIPFGDDEKLGLAKRTITAVVSDALTFVRKKKYAVLYFEQSYYMKDADAAERRADEIKRVTTKGELHLYGERTLATAWDEKSFGVHVTDDKGIAALAEIYEAFQRKDAAIWLGGGGVFQNAGLVLAIVSRVPADKAEGMRAADEDRIKLVAAAKATGIEERLRAAKREWFALSPGWPLKSTHRGDVKTEHPVMFFLNPREQRRYESGWFTVEQLDEWAQDKGPVLKAK